MRMSLLVIIPIILFQQKGEKMIDYLLFVLHDGLNANIVSKVQLVQSLVSHTISTKFKFNIIQSGRHCTKAFHQKIPGIPPRYLADLVEVYE